MVEAKKQFVVIGNMNAITYKEVFPLIKENKMWLGVTNFNDGMYFKVNSDFEYAETYKFEKERNGVKVSRVPGVCWFTNIDHGRRHQPLPLMTMADNRKFNKQLIKSDTGYQKYDNYDAIEIPFTNAIPSDYAGVMGVPISFLDKYSPEQFELVGATESEGRGFSEGLWDEDSKISQATVADERVYKRIFIKHKNVSKTS